MALSDVVILFVIALVVVTLVLTCVAIVNIMRGGE